MDKQNEQKLLDKLEKLIALAGSSNEHEANLAMEKAIELAIANNIELSRLNQKINADEIIKETIGGDKARLPVTHNFVSHIIRTYFNVNIVVGGGRNAGRLIYFIGKKEKVDFAKYLNSFLSNTFFNLWYKYYANHPSQKHSRGAYFLGLWRGLCKALDAAKARAEQAINANEQAGYALMIVDEKKMRDDKTLAIFPKLRNMPSGKINRDSHAEEHGYEQGQKINVHSGLTDNPTLVIDFNK